MKLYIVFIEIFKLYECDFGNTKCFQFEFTTKRDAQIFVYRLGKGKKDLYSVDSTEIVTELDGELIY